MSVTRRGFLKGSSVAVCAMGVTSAADLWALSEEAKPATEAWTFYVANSGSDSWSGKLSESNAAKTNGPFATLERARVAIREMKGKQPPTEQITVMVRGGKYCLDQTLTFGDEDSGSQEFSIIYKAFPGEKAVLSGGQKIKDWKPYKGQILHALLPGAKGGAWKFRQLFFNGEPQRRSRYPKYDASNPLYGGWLFADKPAGKPSKTTFTYKPGSFPRRWTKPQNGEVMMFPQKGWANAILPIKSINEETRVITASQGFRNIDFPPILQSFDNFDSSGDRFRVENLLEELSEPGEWCLDSEEGILYFWPPAGPLKPNDEVVAPALPTLVDINGASWLVFSGFTFTETTDGDDMHRTGVDGADAMTPNQGWKYCGEAVRVRDAEHCVIENNLFYAVGGNGIYLERYASRNVIRRNEISHAGANGVCLLGVYIPLGSVSEPMANGLQPLPKFNEVTDNHIHHCGVLNKYTAGVFLGVSDSNFICHNRIEYLPHHAINLGSNGFGRNIVEYNEIHHVCQEIWDTTAINTWMDNPFTEERAGHLIRFNLITDVVGCHTDPDGTIFTPDGAANGIYLDSNSSNCIVQGNIIVRTSGYSIYVHGGQHNLIENNVLVGSTTTAQVRTMPGTGKIVYTGFRGQVGYFGNLSSAFLTGNRFRNNIIYFGKSQYDQPDPIFYLRPRGDDNHSKGELGDAISESDENIFFRHDNGEYVVTEITQSDERNSSKDIEKTLSFDEWKKQGFDLNSVFADPLFVDAAHDDYRLKPESPALRLGFVPTDIKKIGIRPQL